MISSESCSVSNRPVINDLLWGSCCKKAVPSSSEKYYFNNKCDLLQFKFEIRTPSSCACQGWWWAAAAKFGSVPWAPSSAPGPPPVPRQILPWQVPVAILRSWEHPPWSSSIIQSGNGDPTVKWLMCKMGEVNNPSCTQKGCTLYLPLQKK